MRSKRKISSKVALLWSGCDLYFDGGEKMTCPNCGGNTKVIDSRPQEDSVYRRRECMVCKKRFSTTEIDLEMYQKITKMEAVR